MGFQKYLEGMESNKRRDLGIVALYWKFKKFNFTNQKQAEVELKRSLRAAKNLEPFEDEKYGKQWNGFPSTPILNGYWKQWENISQKNYQN